MIVAIAAALRRAASLLTAAKSGRIYIADIAAYNAGQLRGEWLEPSSDVDELSEQIRSIVAPAEEWAVHDYEDFPDLGEHPSVQSIAEMAAIIEDPNGEAVLALIKAERWYREHLDEALTKARDDLIGAYASEQEFAEEALRDGNVHRDLWMPHVDRAALGVAIRSGSDDEGLAELNDEEIGQMAIDDQLVDDKELIGYVDVAGLADDYTRDMIVAPAGGQVFLFHAS